MSTKKKIISGALAATLVLVLSACSTYYYVQNTTVSITANGSMNLSNFDDSPAHTLIGGLGGASRVSLNGNNTARIQLTNTIDGLNFNASGSYADGDVRFNFKGEAFVGCFPSCGSPIKTNLNKVVAGLNGSHRSNYQGGRLKDSGSTCTSFPSLYTSTNPNMPGTGFVVFNVCDAPMPGSTPFGGGSYYEGSDYVTVYIPSSTNGDLDPFGNYYSGGTLGVVAPPAPTNGVKSGSRQGSQEEDKNSSTSVSVLYPATEPSATPTPIWPSPSPSLT
jgi:hypothetical protein